MSFLTEYFDEYRQRPIRKTLICRPENRWAKLEGKWLEVGKESDNAWTDEETEKFIKATMKSVRGQSTYYNDFCAHLSADFKTRPFIPQPKKKRPCKPKEVVAEEPEIAAPQKPKLAMKDTELMKMAKELYERDMNAPTLCPLPTNARIYGYVRPQLYKTGITEYQSEIAEVAYILVRDNRIPRYHAHNNGRPVWGIPPEGTRQPELDVVPFDGERLY